MAAQRTKTTGNGTPEAKPAGKRAAGGVERAGRTKRAMTEEHQAALRSGREETRIVRNYLEALEQHKPRRGPKRDLAKLAKRLETITEELSSAGPLESLSLHQEKLDLERELAESGRHDHLAELEDSFVGVAASYSARRGISLQAWLAVGVPRQTLKRAGVGSP